MRFVVRSGDRYVEDFGANDDGYSAYVDWTYSQKAAHNFRTKAAADVFANEHGGSVVTLYKPSERKAMEERLEAKLKTQLREHYSAGHDSGIAEERKRVADWLAAWLRINQFQASSKTFDHDIEFLAGRISILSEAERRVRKGQYATDWGMTG